MRSQPVEFLEDIEAGLRAAQAYYDSWRSDGSAFLLQQFRDSEIKRSGVAKYAACTQDFRSSNSCRSHAGSRRMSSTAATRAMWSATS